MYDIKFPAQVVDFHIPKDNRIIETKLFCFCRLRLQAMHI